MIVPLIVADQIVDLVHIHVRKHLSEVRGRTRHELEALFGDLRNEIADILAETNAAEGE
jgi:hypothetical protein